MKIKLLDDLAIQYQLKPSRAKTKGRGKLHLSFKAQTLNIRYTLGIKERDILKFIEQNKAWIIEQNEKQKALIRHFVNNEEYLFLGKKYNLQINVSKHESIILSNKIIHIYTSDPSFEHIKQLVDRWKDEQIEAVFPEILFQSFLLFKDQIALYPMLQFKNYKSRWGCCFPKQNKIILNKSLIHVPLALIEYVIVHELVHFIYPNHCKEFHQLLNELIVDQKKKRRELAKYQVNYQ